jgi:L-fuculose-phosphate aldolase
LLREIIRWGHLAWERGLLAGTGGNMSGRLDSGEILITRHQAALGFLEEADIANVLPSGDVRGKGCPSSELPLHLAIYREIAVDAVFHAHPPTAIAFSASEADFLPISLEDKLSFGNVPVLDFSQTPTVTDPDRVAAELKQSRVVILKNHGTVVVGRSLAETFHMTDLLEAALKGQLLKSLFSSTEHPSKQKPAQPVSQKKAGPAIFSPEHVQSLVNLVNKRPEIGELGRKTRFTTSLSFQVVDGEAPRSWTFHFTDGHITGWEENADAPYVFSASRETWDLVFRGRLDPFVATVQGVISLTRGELRSLSKWYQPCQKVFEIWQKNHRSVRR